jgi:hypothetical protein
MQSNEMSPHEATLFIFNKLAREVPSLASCTDFQVYDSIDGPQFTVDGVQVDIFDLHICELPYNLYNTREFLEELDLRCPDLRRFCSQTRFMADGPFYYDFPQGCFRNLELLSISHIGNNTVKFIKDHPTLMAVEVAEFEEYYVDEPLPPQVSVYFNHVIWEEGSDEALIAQLSKIVGHHPRAIFIGDCELTHSQLEVWNRFVEGLLEGAPEETPEGAVVT